MAKIWWRLFLFSLILTLICNAGSAQNFGVKMYYNFAKNLWEDPEGSLFEEEFASKYALGPYVEFRFIPYLSISAEVLFDKKGGIIASPGEKGIEYRLNYVSFPLLLHFYVFPVSSIQFYVSGGIEYSRLIKGKAYDLDLDQEVEDGIREKLAKNDICFLFGLGMKINIKITRVILEGRYSIGQNDIFLPQYLVEGESFKNVVISFGVGFKF